MNNQELETKVKELLSINNYFDMVLAAKDFEKEYKNSDFFKATKKSLSEVIKEAKVYYTLQLNDLKRVLQNLLNDLDYSKVSEVLDKAMGTFTMENNEITNMLNTLKDITAE